MKLTPLLLLLLCIPVPAQHYYRVGKVADGDTVRLIGIKSSIRLLGINAPEATNRHIEPGGLAATAFLSGLLSGHTVRLGYEPKARRDRFRRFLYYLWRDDGMFVNLEMVRRGFARYEPRFRTRFAHQLADAQAAAKAEKLGIWSTDAN